MKNGADVSWRDLTFVRGTGNRDNWLAAFTSRHKLVVSPEDSPWLIDIQKDPDELTNFCAYPAYREIVQTLAGELLRYGERFKDEQLYDLSQDIGQVTNVAPAHGDITGRMSARLEEILEGEQTRLER